MNDGQFDFSWIYNTLSAAGAALVTWFFSRKKQKTEVESSEIDNVEKAITIWRQIASDLEGKFSALQTQVYDLQKRVLTLELENQRLESENLELKHEIVTR